MIERGIPKLQIRCSPHFTKRSYCISIILDLWQGFWQWNYQSSPKEAFYLSLHGVPLFKQSVASVLSHDYKTLSNSLWYCYMLNVHGFSVMSWRPREILSDILVRFKCFIMNTILYEGCSRTGCVVKEKDIIHI